MKNTAIIGIQNGDEGKGAICHYFSPKFDYCVRFSGGGNAGHTIYRDGKKYVHNLLPSVDYRHKHIKSYLGSGMVIDLIKLCEEIDRTRQDFPHVPQSIYIDKDAFLVEEKHKQEDKEKNSWLGSTNQGVGPAYKEKINRTGHRINDLLRHTFTHVAYEEAIRYLLDMGVNFVNVLEMKEELSCASILFEGAQSMMLDVNHGIYPYISCGNAGIEGIYASGFGFAIPETIYGIAKIYNTKVGSGPFPTMIEGTEADELREAGKEYGAVTGRPRKIGWIDLPALKFACQKGQITNLIITKFDIFNRIDKVKMCYAYQKEPVCSDDFFDAQPKFTEVKGWNNSKNIEELRPFLDQVEKVVELPIEYISCGVNENDIIKIEK